nr:immunoglobulin light chain junction region [Macaca mulatta]MOV79440.1 immunoglobulin light chain junction region [Macaca mulatta]MOV80239.1 immunoglobulin light chain junction region [Macaca mulatta]MOV80581.1 immunoglobulin light chain junction region [Macaca mulatta]MOV80708.1 immunoglobulin light chain junction region [Macaca mulatta]
CQQGYSFPFTF